LAPISQPLIVRNEHDIRRTDDGGVLHVHGKGNKDRRIPFGRELLDVLERYLETRAARFPKRAGDHREQTR
jgi:site-specific recombinase XerD